MDSDAAAQEKDAQEKGQKMAEDILKNRPQDAEGLRDLQNLSLSMGLPATRALFRQMMSASPASAAVKLEVARAVAGLSPVTEIGCMKVDYRDRMNGQPAIAYLLLGPCDKNHDMVRQINNLRPFVDEEKWTEVLRHLSMLMYFGRNVYANSAKQLREQIASLELGPVENFLEAKVDIENSTIYVQAGWPRRIGIFIRSENDTADIEDV